MNDGGPAFPFPCGAEQRGMADGYVQRQSLSLGCPGMSLRDYLATHADIPWDRVKANCHEGCSEGSFPTTDEKLLRERARLRYLDAECMLAERDRREQTKEPVWLMATKVNSIHSGNSCDLIDIRDGISVYGHHIPCSEDWNDTERLDFIHAMRSFADEVSGRREETKDAGTK